jgi:hypothetical protein
VSTDKFNDSKPGSSGQRTGRMNFGMVDKHVMRDPRLPLTVKALYSYLSTYCGATRSAFPSRQTMAKELGCAVRTVDAALKAGVEAGLWTVTGRAGDDGRQTSNLYLIHDFEGGYEARGAESARGDSAEICTVPVPESAPEQDHLSKPSSNQTTFTSGDAYAASGQRTSSQTDMKIMVGDDYWTMEASRLMQYLTACVIATLNRAELPLRPEGRKLIGKALRARVEAGTTYQKILDDVQYWVSNEAEWSQLAYLPESRAA